MRLYQGIMLRKINKAGIEEKQKKGKTKSMDRADKQDRREKKRRD